MSKLHLASRGGGIVLPLVFDHNYEIPVGQLRLVHEIVETMSPGSHDVTIAWASDAPGAPPTVHHASLNLQASQRKRFDRVVNTLITTRAYRREDPLSITDAHTLARLVIDAYEARP